MNLQMQQPPHVETWIEKCRKNFFYHTYARHHTYIFPIYFYILLLTSVGWDSWIELLAQGLWTALFQHCVELSGGTLGGNLE
ncbi:hypothetical protein V1477_006190 [Vespula maculifrons]|uniref:Uncharacterized protein n=1 Tax=Vespula maculifrons TaxID=7453 RepID=A0ABD2CJQ4_VESMC